MTAWASSGAGARVPVRLVLALGFLLGASQTLAAVSPKVTAVRLTTDSPIGDRANLERLITVVPGESLELAAVRGSLRNLWASGRAARLEAWSQPADAGVAGEVEVVFTMALAMRVERVELEGELGVRAATLRAVLLQRPGEPLVEDRVLRGLRRMEETLAAQGFAAPTVRVGVDVDDRSKTAVVRYRVEAGPRFEIAEIAIDGDLGPYQATTLLAAGKLEPGLPYVQAEVRAAAERVRRFLLDAGYRQASVGSPQAERLADGYAMRVRLPVEVGPLLRLEVHGADEKTLARQGLLPFLGSEGYDGALLVQAAERIKEAYQRKGHYRVQVETREERSPGLLRVELSVEPGAVYTIRELLFATEAEVDRRTLERLMTTRDRRGLVPGSGRLVDAVLAADLSNLRSYFALAGYRGTVVGPPRVEELGEGELRVVIPIRQGRRRTVSALRVEGSRALDEATLLAGLPLAVGGPYHSRLLDDAVALIRNRYVERGFDEVQVSTALDWSADEREVGVVFHLLEGVQGRTDRVIVRGNQHTSTDVIVRTIGLEPGAPLNTERVLGLQRRLYDLGVFSRVDVSLLRDAPFTAGRDVVVRVEEGRARRVSYGLGYDSEDGPRGLLLLGHSNLLGQAILGQLDLRLAQRDRQLRFLLRQPLLGRWVLPVTYAVYYQEEDSDRFVGEIRGTRVQASRLFRPLRLDLFYNYRIVDGEAQAGAEADRELSNVAISSLTPSIFVDRRDDPIEPRSGWSHLAQLEYAFPAFSADEHFVKLLGAQTVQWTLPVLDSVLALGLRAGAIEDFSNETATQTDGSVFNPVPSVERFFAGGRASHRAFARDSLGIPGVTLDDGRGVGGNGLLLANLDWRFPISGAFGGVLFADWGNVWGDWRDVDPQDGRFGAGLGLRYGSPIGPLRVEIGWKLDRRDDESPYAVFVSLGNPF